MCVGVSACVWGCAHVWGEGVRVWGCTLCGGVHFVCAVYVHVCVLAACTLLCLGYNDMPTGKKCGLVLPNPFPYQSQVICMLQGF